MNLSKIFLSYHHHYHLPPRPQHFPHHRVPPQAPRWQIHLRSGQWFRTKSCHKRGLSHLMLCHIFTLRIILSDVVMCQQQFLIRIRKMKMIITIILQLSSPPSPGCTRSWTPSRGAVGAGSDAKWCRRKYGTGLLGSQQSCLSGIFYI